MGFVQTWAEDNTTVMVKAPTITPGSCEYNGTIIQSSLLMRVVPSCM